MTSHNEKSQFRNRVALIMAAFVTISCSIGAYFHNQGARLDAISTIMIVAVSLVGGLLLWAVLRGVFAIVDLIQGWWDSFEKKE